jgi:hypothetical protein
MTNKPNVTSYTEHGFTCVPQRVRTYRKWGYYVRTDMVYPDAEIGGKPFEMQSAYTLGDQYIGTPKWAYRLCKQYGIKPEYRTPHSRTCSIGWSEEKQQFFGWSHRAICGFGIGSTVKPGDCAFQPASRDEFIADTVGFWTADDGQRNMHYEVVTVTPEEYDAQIPATQIVHDDGGITLEGGNQQYHEGPGDYLVLTYESERRTRTKSGRIAKKREWHEWSHMTKIPDTFGRGAWTALTLDDAKQMAIDFAEGVG